MERLKTGGWRRYGIVRALDLGRLMGVSDYSPDYSLREMNMWKWLGGIVAAVLIWWLTQGALEVIKRPVPQAPSPTPTPAFSVTGSWNYSMKSNVSGNTHTGAMILTQDGSLVSGILEKTFDNSKTGLKGTLLGNTLELVRDTGLDTIQTYRLSKSSDNQMTGMFENVGKYPDSGSIELQR